jgi:uncharacterized protein (TIGR00297 family)
MKSRRMLLAVCLSTAIGVAGRRRKALTPSGAAGAVVVGSPVFYGGGIRWASVLLTFFTSSSFLSRRLARPGSRRTNHRVEPKGAERDIVQALANGGVAAVVASLHAVSPGAALEYAFAGSLAAANSDTWATEVGKTSRKPPRMILSGVVATPGTSGAISARGLVASVWGSAVIALVAAASVRSAHGRRPRCFLSVFVAGMSGSLADSIAGATVQAVYRCPTCGTSTEWRIHRCGTPTILASGLAWCTNDAVNLGCTTVGALTAAGLSRFGEPMDDRSTTRCRRRPYSLPLRGSTGNQP